MTVAAAAAAAVVGAHVGLALGLLVGLVGSLAGVLLLLRDQHQGTASATGELSEALRAAHSALDLERAWRDGLVDALARPAVMFDTEGYLVRSNAAAEELIGTQAPGAPQTALQVAGNPAVAASVRAAGGAGTSNHDEFETVLAGHEVRVAVSRMGDGVLVTWDDLSERRRIDDLRRDFVVNASHELKTPATSIQALAEALELIVEKDPGRVPELVVRLRVEAERLIAMVHDLLSLRRLEDGASAAPTPVDAAALTRDVVAELLDRAEQRDVEVSLDAPDELVLPAFEDELRLVVRNLVANAIQYNRPDGTVEIALDPASDDGSVRLIVTDSGIGIPQHDLERVFERFYRVDAARSRQMGGTGLGLAITRHAVERMGGTITIDSLVGSGTTVTVTLPGPDEPTTQETR